MRRSTPLLVTAALAALASGCTVHYTLTSPKTVVTYTPASEGFSPELVARTVAATGGERAAQLAAKIRGESLAGASLVVFPVDAVVHRNLLTVRMRLDATGPRYSQADVRDVDRKCPREPYDRRPRGLTCTYERDGREVTEYRAAVVLFAHRFMAAVNGQELLTNSASPRLVAINGGGGLEVNLTFKARPGVKFLKKHSISLKLPDMLFGATVLETGSKVDAVGKKNKTPPPPIALQVVEK